MAVPTITLEYVEEWLDDELRNYVYDKFDLGADKRNIIDFNHVNNTTELDDNWWSQQLDNYYYRASMLGVDTPGGRQALGKFVATAIGMLVAAVDEYGELPDAGVSSGGNYDNLRKLAIDG